MESGSSHPQFGSNAWSLEVGDCSLEVGACSLEVAKSCSLEVFPTVWKYVSQYGSVSRSLEVCFFSLEVVKTCSLEVFLQSGSISCILEVYLAVWK